MGINCGAVDGARSDDEAIGLLVGVDAAPAKLLHDGGAAIEYLESDAGHFVPPEVIPPARALVERVLG